jgi:hypothetical protein
MSRNQFIMLLFLNIASTVLMVVMYTRLRPTLKLLDSTLNKTNVTLDHPIQALFR